MVRTKNSPFGSLFFLKVYGAPRVGFEPTTISLTGSRSTTELPRNTFILNPLEGKSTLCYPIPMNAKEWIRTIYLYLATLVGLILIIIGSVRLIDLGLKAIVFRGADVFVNYPNYPVPAERSLEKTPAGEIAPEDMEKFRKEQAKAEMENLGRERQRTAASSLSMIIVGIPLFLFHWRIIKKDRK